MRYAKTASALQDKAEAGPVLQERNYVAEKVKLMNTR